jgi:hypothetical protein
LGPIACSAETPDRHLFETGNRIGETRRGVVIQRWEQLTGKSVILDGDGRTFAEIGQERRVDSADASQC